MDRWKAAYMVGAREVMLSVPTCTHLLLDFRDGQNQRGRMLRVAVDVVRRYLAAPVAVIHRAAVIVVNRILRVAG